jgi:hypothetical protein
MAHCTSSPIQLLLRLVPLLASCSRPAPPVLPDADDTDALWLIHEVLPINGAERTGAWRESFDVDGCHRQASNSWLWVFDPVLRRSTEPALFWNAGWPERPDFCLTARQLGDMQAALRDSWTDDEPPPDFGWIERWTARGAGEVQVWVFPLGHPPTGLLPLLDAVAIAAAEGVWGQSPEQGGLAER